MRNGGVAMEVIRPHSRRPQPPTQTIILAGDDTLWVTQWLYDQAAQELRLIAESGGLNGAAWAEEFQRRDRDNVRQFGLGQARLGTSAITAYTVLCEQAGIRAQARIVAQMERAAEAVVHREAPLAAGAEEVLRTLRQDYQLILLTRGDPAVQRRRLRDSRLGSLLDGIVIVPEKSEQSFGDTCSEFGVDPATVVVVGSHRSTDIDPALRLGMRAVLIDAGDWAAGAAPDPGSPAVCRVSCLRAVVRALALGGADTPAQYRPRSRGPRHTGPDIAA